MKKILLLLSLLPALTLQAGELGSYYRDLPISLTAPSTPSIPDYSLSLKEFGGVGDGVADNTAAFQKAVSALEKAGGGRLTVSEGKEASAATP